MRTEAPAAWQAIANESEIPSPALLLYVERIGANIAQMIAIAGSPDRLRPHIKTHKLPELMRMQLEAGITKYKCATIAEAEMAADAGARDVLIAFPLVGPNATRLAQLQVKNLQVQFSAVADSPRGVAALEQAAQRYGLRIPVYLDLDCGMHRTGIAPDSPLALELYALLSSSPNLRAAGFHAYDGHLHQSDVTARHRACEEAFAPVLRLREAAEGRGLAVPVLIAGGSPTFAIHAAHPDRELSPGTTVLWDFGYADKLPDLPFQPAALLLTRVVSKPTANRLCLDLGHKAVASENPHPRVRIIGLEDAEFVVHSEEHLVIETERAAEFEVGDALYAIPRHVCLTVALYDHAYPVENGVAGKPWKVTARARMLNV